MPRKSPSGRNRAGSRNHPPRRRLVRQEAAAPGEAVAPSATGSLPSRLSTAPTSRLARHEAPAARTTFDYSYVVSDLRRIAIGFGGIIVVLIILSFVIR